MTLAEIRALPTSIKLQGGSTETHESITRSWHTLNKVIELLEKKCPHAVIIEIIHDIKDAPHSTWEQK